MQRILLMDGGIASTILRRGKSIAAILWAHLLMCCSIREDNLIVSKLVSPFAKLFAYLGPVITDFQWTERITLTLKWSRFGPIDERKVLCFLLPIMRSSVRHCNIKFFTEIGGDYTAARGVKKRIRVRSWFLTGVFLQLVSSTGSCWSRTEIYAQSHLGHDATCSIHLSGYPISTTPKAPACKSW